MCKKKICKTSSTGIDKCMVPLIKFMNKKHLTVACCCGHGKYPMTIVVKEDDVYREILSRKIIPRTRRFYQRDPEGYYFIPEVVA